MKKSLFYFLAIWASITAVYSQPYYLKQAKSFGGAATDESVGNQIIDASGNRYLTGGFEGTCDFDPGAAKFELTSSSTYWDTYISKLDASGNFVWARQFVNSEFDVFKTANMAMDASGNIYLAGSFKGTMDLDPGTGTNNVTSTGKHDVYIIKLNNSGNFVWAKTIGDTGVEYANGIVTDPSGNLYITGGFSGSVDFDPGAGSTKITSVGSTDMFVCKLNSSGAFTWVKKLGNALDIARNAAIITDASGNIFLGGAYTGTVDFDPGAGVANQLSKGAADIFILKLDASGNFIWTRSLGGKSSDNVKAMALESSGNLYILGSFMGTADFDPGVDSLKLTAAGSDVFITKLNSSGNLVWARSFGGSSYDFPNDFCIDGSGNAYLIGNFNGTMDFDPGTGTVNLTSAGSGDIYILKLNNAGNYVWAYRAGGTQGDEGNAIDVDAAGDIYYAGGYAGTVNFNPSGSTSLTSSGAKDAFVCKISMTNSGIKSDDYLQSQLIYPNPNNGKFMIDSENFNEKQTIEIYDAIGNKVYTVAEVEAAYTFDLSGNAPGIYLVKLTDGSNKVRITKFLKQ